MTADTTPGDRSTPPATTPKKVPTPEAVEKIREKIRAADRRYAGRHIGYGKALNKIKDACIEAHGHGKWLPLLESSGVDVREAQKCMRVANNPVLSNASNLPFIPSALSTQDFLAGQDQGVVQDLFDSKAIHPGTTEEQAKELILGPAEKPQAVGWKPPTGVMDAAAKLFGVKKAKEVGEFRGQMTKVAWKGACVAWPPLSGRGVDDWWGHFWEGWHSGALDQAIVLTHLNIAPTPRFTTTARSAAALCFLLGKLGVPERALVAFYFGDKREDFDALFTELGMVLPVYPLEMDVV